METILGLFVLATLILVPYDAAHNRITTDGKPYKLGNGALTWFIGLVILWPIVLLIYIYKRGTHKPEPVAAARPAGRMKRCPECAEEIQAAAVKCRYCQAVIAPRPRPVSREAV